MNNSIELWQLRQRQGHPLEIKMRLSEERIRAWHDHYQGNVYVAFSGGKDSTVLLHLVRSLYPDVPAVFSDTGLEYPEIRDFVKQTENVVWLKPKVSFKTVIERYGYPVISKRQAQYIKQVQRTSSENLRRLRLTGLRINGTRSQMSKIADRWQILCVAPFRVSDECCHHMKRQPMLDYYKQTGRVPFIGTMASEGGNREKDYLLYGCNAYDMKEQPRSTPLAFWTEADIWEYLRRFNVPYSTIYDMGYKRTGCMFCMFGVHLEGCPNRFQRMKETHPKQWDYCIHKLGLGQVLDYIGVEYDEPRQQRLFAGGE